MDDDYLETVIKVRSNDEDHHNYVVSCILELMERIEIDTGLELWTVTNRGLQADLDAEEEEENEREERELQRELDLIKKGVHVRYRRAPDKDYDQWRRDIEALKWRPQPPIFEEWGILEEEENYVIEEDIDRRAMAVFARYFPTGFSWARYCFPDWWEHEEREKLWSLEPVDYNFDDPPNRREAMSGSAEHWVRERRLRPVYELLDSGNNKKVITEADKLLKKQSNFPCAKVLKALALIRLNKPQEARQILEPVTQEAPTDDATVQALSICYRELEEPSTLAAVLEAASKKDQSEELLTHSFMAHVRVEDYHKQHLTALNLYKTFNKSSYFGWAVASLLLKYERLSKVEQADRMSKLSLQLAERMCDKFLEEHKVMEESILFLYLRCLQRLEKWDKLVEVSVKHKYPVQNISNDEFHEMYCEALSNLEMLDQLFDYLKGRFFDNVDDFDVLMQIINRFLPSHQEKVEELLNDVRYNVKSRAVVISDLAYCVKASKVDSMDRSARILEDMQLALDYGAEKPSTHCDLGLFMKYISVEDAESMLRSVDSKHSPNEPNYDHSYKIITDVNFEMLHRDIRRRGKDYLLIRLKRADRSLGKYLVCSKNPELFRTETDMKTKEPDYHDMFLIASSTNLLAEYYNQICGEGQDNFVSQMIRKKDQWIWDDDHPYELRDMKKGSTNLRSLMNQMALDDVQQRLEPEVEPEDRIHLFIAALLSLEYGLKKSPYNHYIRTLLGKLLCSVGAADAGLKVIQQLDFKHLQWDSLGYLVLSEALNSGLYTEAMRMLTSAESLYTAHKRECMEYVIAGYKYGSFHKIDEFLSFRNHLFESAQYYQAFCEKRMLEYFMSTNNWAELQKIAEAIDKDLKPEFLKPGNFFDNRDFSMLRCLAENFDEKKMQALTAKTDAHYYKIRIALLFLLTKLMKLASRSDAEGEGGKEDWTEYIAMFEERVRSWDSLYSSFKPCKLLTPLMHGLWPPRCQTYKELGCFSVLLEVLDPLKEISRSKIIEQSLWEKFSNKLIAGCETLLKNLTDCDVGSDHGALSDLKIDTRFTHLHFFIETLSFLRIMLECAVKMDKIPKKNRAEKLVRTRLHTETKMKMHSCVMKFVNYITDFRSSLMLNDSPYQKLNFIKVERIFSPSFLFDVFQTDAEDEPFFTKITSSILIQTEEMRKVAQGLADFIWSGDCSRVV